MNIWSFLFPILVVVGLGFYYLRVYSKGKAVGGGLGEGFAAMQREKWNDVLSPGEDVKVWGTGVLWRPRWQYWLASQVPLLKLFWPMKFYQLILTDRSRLLLATYSTFGGLSNKEGHDKAAIKLADVSEEEQGWAIKLNPMIPAGYKTFSATLQLPSRPLKLYGIPGDFFNALSS